MTLENVSFLQKLLSTPGPSGDESAVAKVWRAEARGFADRVEADVHGNSIAILESAGPRVLLAGHIDEIGIMVHYIDDDGYLYIQPIGGWDPQVLVGQRVRLTGREGDVIGVIGRKPLHLLTNEELGTASKMKNLWVDLGVNNREEALKLLRVGTVGVIDAPLHHFPNDRLVSRSLDNRIGAFIVLEVLRRLSKQRSVAHVAAVATTQEETTSAGASVAAFRFDPHVSLVVDVTYSTDTPDSDKKLFGDVRLGGGPVLIRGSANSPLVYDRLLDIVEQQEIPYSLQPSPQVLGTDADIIYMVRSGVATGTICVPIRYLHSPNEMIASSDVEHVIQVIMAFVESIQTETEFIEPV